MKFFAAACLLALVAFASAENQYCYGDVTQSCSGSNVVAMPRCNALYGGFQVLQSEMQAYANLHLQRSYEYLLTATYFSNYQTNREGFGKLFRKLSDDAWESTIDLMKHITKRGGSMDFNQRSRLGANVHQENLTVELHELGSLSRALEVEKEIAERAHHIHKEAIRNRDQLHDAEIAQYLEEEFIEKQADRIRSLAGHTNDLTGFIGDKTNSDVSLALYLFDQYLTKTA